MWSNVKDYFHYNPFPRLAQGVSYLKQCSSAPMPLHEQFRVTGTLIPPPCKKGCTGSKQISSGQMSWLQQLHQWQEHRQVHSASPPGHPSSLQQTLVYRFPELGDTPFLVLGLTFLGLSWIIPELI